MYRLMHLCHKELLPADLRGESHHAADVVLDAWRCEKELAKGAAVGLLIGHTDARQLPNPNKESGTS